MSLLHKPTYTKYYDEEDDSLGLNKLLWSQFMCKCGKCGVETGSTMMESIPIVVLDQIALEERMRFDVRLAYVCEKHGDDLGLPFSSSYRLGVAVKIRVLNPMKRMLLIRGLIVRGVTRIAISKDYIEFDTDDLKKMALYYR